MKKHIRFFIIVLLIPLPCFAGVTGLSPTWYSTPDSASLQTAINGATAGDTINVSAGDGTEDYAANAVTIPQSKQPLKIIGPGASNLTINLTGHNALTIQSYAGSLTTPGTRISGFTFVSPLDSKYTAINAKGQGWRIDNNTYQCILTATASTGGFFVVVNDLNSTTSMAPYGVIDNNTVINGKVNVSGPYSSASQSAAWYDALDLGGNTATYVENNDFSTTVNAKCLAIDNDTAAKMVIRYNNFTNADTMTHSLENDADRGTRKSEWYGNLYTLTQDGVHSFIEVQAGTGVAFYNNIVGASGYSNYAFMVNNKRHTDVAIGWLGNCDGTVEQIWDGNEAGQSGSPCRDQIGLGADTTNWTGYNGTSCNVGSDCYNTISVQSKIPFYAWQMIGAGNATVLNSDPTHIVANRDYYYTNSSFNGTSGVGCGTLGNRPVTCTIGVAYWATNQSCADLTGMVGMNPATPISGTLYKCTATDTWTSYYTPYTYPHPLRGNRLTLGSGSTFSLGSGAGFTLN